MRLPVGSVITSSIAARRCGRRLAVEHVEPHDHLLEAEVTRGGREPARQPLHELGVEEDRRGREEHDAVPLHAPVRIANAEVVAQAARRLEEIALECRHVQARLVDVVVRASDRARRPARSGARRRRSRGCGCGSSSCLRARRAARPRSSRSRARSIRRAVSGWMPCRPARRRIPPSPCSQVSHWRGPVGSSHETVSRSIGRSSRQQRRQRLARGRLLLGVVDGNEAARAPRCAATARARPRRSRRAPGGRASPRARAGARRRRARRDPPSKSSRSTCTGPTMPDVCAIGRLGAYRRRTCAASATARRRGSASSIQRPTRSKTGRGADARCTSTPAGGSSTSDSAAESQASTSLVVRSASLRSRGPSKIA